MLVQAGIGAGRQHFLLAVGCAARAESQHDRLGAVADGTNAPAGVGGRQVRKHRGHHHEVDFLLDRETRGFQAAGGLCHAVAGGGERGRRHLSRHVVGLHEENRRLHQLAHSSGRLAPQGWALGLVVSSWIKWVKTQVNARRTLAASTSVAVLQPAELPSLAKFSADRPYTVRSGGR